MRLQDAYRLALAKGLTAKQAGAEFGLSHDSISKIKNRYGFPSLISEWEFADRQGIAKMKDEEIKSYMEVLLKKGHNEHKDLKYCQDELEKRSK